MQSMVMTNNISASPDVVALPAILDMAAAQALKDTLSDVIAADVDITVDGAPVERVGTPAIQVLLAAAKSAAAGGRSFSLVQPSDVLRSAFADLGMAEVLARWSKANG
jgi:chemotaxis protein CheX